MTSSRWPAPSDRMTIPKSLLTLLPNCSQMTRCWGQNFYPNFLALRRGHTSGHQNPRQRPATPPVTKSTMIRSDVTCTTVTFSQAAFMQPLKQGQGMTLQYSSLLSQPIPRRGSLQDPLPLPGYTQVERTEPVLPAQTNVAGAEVATDSVHAGVITIGNTTANNH